jgi:plastocyanin
MANIDKAAIAFSIAIVAVGVGFAAYAGYAQDNAPVAKAPVIANTEPKMQVDPMANIAEKVKSAAASTEKTEELKEEVKMETKPVTPVETEPVETEPVETEPVETEPVETSEPKTVSVTIPAGTSSPGCETSNACYTPASVTINAGDTVKWDNVDTAAHTVTSGSPADGPSGVFDSSLVMGKASFEHTFDKAGTYDYFCMVHPWMVGNVIVN